MQNPGIVQGDHGIIGISDKGERRIPFFAGRVEQRIVGALDMKKYYRGDARYNAHPRHFFLDRTHHTTPVSKI
jgi:hypothetical protein